MRYLPIWWLLGFGLELVLGGHLRPGEVAVAAGVATATALLAVAAVRAFGTPWHTPHFVGALWWLPVDLVTDSVRLVGQLVRRTSSGRTRELDVPGDEQCGIDERLAYSVLLVSASPGTYVRGVSDDESTLHLHSRVPPGRIERSLRE